jgi:hypothetical protein
MKNQYFFNAMIGVHHPSVRVQHQSPVGFVQVMGHHAMLPEEELNQRRGEREY